jgi:hypothetical protein
MSIFQTLSSLAALMLLTSCTTSMLWDATDPQEYVVVSRDEITEAELKEMGLDYEVSEKWNVYYVEKSILQKTRDYVYRSFATPVTVTIDVLTPVVVVGGLGYVIINADGVGHIDCEQFMSWLSSLPEGGERSGCR